jgi:hypothetical protein
MPPSSCPYPFPTLPLPLPYPYPTPTPNQVREASAPLLTASERPRMASARFSHTPQDCDIFAVTGMRSDATPLPLLATTELPLFHSKRRDGPFTPRDNLRSNGLFS